MLETSSANPRASLLPLTGMSLCAVAAGLGIAVVLAMNAGWTGGGSEVVPALWGAFCVVIGAASALIGLRLLLSLGQVPLAMAVVGAGVIRMMSSLAAGLAVYFVVVPEGKTFWAAFLACNLFALVVETMWGIKSNNRDAGTASVSGSV